MQDNSSSNRRTGPPNIWLPPGFRFHPTDDELITFYLMKKVVNNKFCAHAIADVDLNKYEPWDLPDKANMGEKEWYFFSLRDRKYPTGMRTNRATEAGYWKATGKDRDVRGGSNSSNHNSLVGMKKTLVFYKGRAPRGEKTNWVMHEYRLEGKTAYLYGSRAAKEEWVVCRIFQKRALAAKLKLGQHHALGEDSDVPSSPMMEPIKQEYKSSPMTMSMELEADASCNDHLSCITTTYDNNNNNKDVDHHHNCNNSWLITNNSSLFKNGGLYTSGDFVKLLDPDFLPGLRGSGGCCNPSVTTTTPPPLVFSKGAPLTNFTDNNNNNNVSCKTGHTKPCKTEPYNSSPSAADSLINYNKIVEASFAGLLGGGSESNNSTFDHQQQQQQQQQQISAEQGFLNELLFSRFLADPPPSGSSDLDQLYAY